MALRRGTWVVITLIFMAVLASAGAMVLVAIFAGAPARVPARAALQVKIEAPFSEVEPADVLSQLLRTSPTLRQTLDAIRRAKADSRVTTLVIRPVSGGVLWAQVQEVRAAIEDFKTSGKPVVAYLESAGPAEYYMATAADRVVLMPAGELDLTGIASYELFFRGALEKLGVVPDLLHIGDYKTAANTFTERGFTPAHREMTASLNRDWFDELVRAVAAGRKLSAPDASRLVGGGPYLAKEALEHKLVDALSYEDQLDDDAPIRETEPIEFDEYERAVSVPGQGERRPHCAALRRRDHRQRRESVRFAERERGGIRHVRPVGAQGARRSVHFCRRRPHRQPGWFGDRVRGDVA